MAKFFGTVGYEITEETVPGVWTPTVVERQYYGDLIRNTRRLTSPDKVNSDITLSNEISIIADAYAYQNFHALRYVEFMGTKWEITSVEVRTPRLILSVGGVYNG